MMLKSTSLPNPTPVFTPFDPSRYPIMESTRLVSARLSIRARIHATVMRSADVGSGRSTVVLDGIAILSTLSAQVVSRTEVGGRDTSFRATCAEAVLIEPARGFVLQSIRVPVDDERDPGIALCWLDHEFAPIGEEARMGRLGTQPLRHSFLVSLPIDVRLWVTARRGDSAAAVELGGEITLERGVLARLGLRDPDSDAAAAPNRPDSVVLAASPRSRIVSIPSQIVPIVEGESPRISVRFLGDEGAQAGFEYIVGRYVNQLPASA